MANKMKINQKDYPNNQNPSTPVNVHQGPSMQNTHAKRQNKKANKNSHNPNSQNQYQ